jgi:hypothetical protein
MRGRADLGESLASSTPIGWAALGSSGHSSTQ